MCNTEFRKGSQSYAKEILSAKLCISSRNSALHILVFLFLIRKILCFYIGDVLLDSAVNNIIQIGVAS